MFHKSKKAYDKQPKRAKTGRAPVNKYFTCKQSRKAKKNDGGERCCKTMCDPCMTRWMETNCLRERVSTEEEKQAAEKEVVEKEAAATAAMGKKGKKINSKPTRASARKRGGALTTKTMTSKKYDDCDHEDMSTWQETDDRSYVKEGPHRRRQREKGLPNLNFRCWVCKKPLLPCLADQLE